MIWYWCVDFLKSRLGRVLLFCLMIAGAFLLVARHQKTKREAGDLTGKLPSLAATGTWSENAAGSNPGKGDYAMSERRADYRPFRPVELRPEQRMVKPDPSLEQKPVKESFVPLPPLITYEHGSDIKKPAATKPAIPKPIVKLPIEEGALLHCRLVTPVTPGEGDAPVLAELTRPLIRRGRVLLPAGAQLSGKLSSVNNGRFFFDEQWRVRLPSGSWAGVSGQVQEAAYDSFTNRYAVDDGKAGLAGIVNAQGKKKANRWVKILGTATSAAGRLAKERTRTAIGENIPSTVRNTVLEGTSTVIDGYVEKLAKPNDTKKAEVVIEGGKGFYLYVRNKEE